MKFYLSLNRNYQGGIRTGFDRNEAQYYFKKLSSFVVLPRLSKITPGAALNHSLSQLLLFQAHQQSLAHWTNIQKFFYKTTSKNNTYFQKREFRSQKNISIQSLLSCFGAIKFQKYKVFLPFPISFLFLVQCAIKAPSSVILDNLCKTTRR